jgi:Fe2+ or Zn2+ uptake regulation protein
MFEAVGENQWEEYFNTIASSLKPGGKACIQTIVIAEELFERIRRTDSRASRATVYRTISLLVEAGLLREIDLGSEEKTYDPNFLDKPSHNHLVCVDCGKVVEFEDAHIDLLND